MAYKVIMPKAGMAMETGKIVRWLKAEGDPIETGEPLLEIETDKVNMEVESMNTGVLLKILAHEGEDIPVVQTIGYIGEKGEEMPREGETVVKQMLEETKMEKTQTEKVALVSNGTKIPATPAARRIAMEKGIDLKEIKPTGSFGQIKATDVRKPGVKSTPLARAIAQDKGIDMQNLAGSGYNGKVTKADVLSMTQTAPIQASDQDELIPHSAMRKVVAKRLLQSHLEIPPVTQSCIADVTELTAMRKKINAELDDTKISFNDLIIMAVVKTLKEQPNINASFTQDGLILKKKINIGVAVALPDGLIVPVIKDADTLSLKQISTEAKALAIKAKDGKLMPDEYSGGTFTISNLGMMGVTSFTPIINQPESAILGVCAVQQKLEMDDDGNIQKRLKMGLSLTYDHRSIDGAQAAIFSNRIVALLEKPLSMLV